MHVAPLPSGATHDYSPVMGVIARNAELAIRDALSREPLVPLTRAFERYADLRRSAAKDAIH